MIAKVFALLLAAASAAPVVYNDYGHSAPAAAVSFSVAPKVLAQPVYAKAVAPAYTQVIHSAPVVQKAVSYQPQYVHSAPQYVHAAPQVVHAAPQYVHSAPQVVHAAPQYVHSAPQVVHAAPQYVHSAPQVVHAAPQYVHSAPQVVHAAPQYVHSAPQVVHAAPQIVHAAPQVVHAAPQYVHAAPQVVHAAPQYVSAPVVHKQLVAKVHVPEPIDPNPKYSFAYGVTDPHTGDSKTAEEHLENGIVHGSYSLVEPDGHVRKVTYTADHVNGFNAVVERSGGHAVAAAPVTKVIAAPAHPW